MRIKTRKRSSIAALRRRRQQLLRQLPPLDRLLRGSLIERYKPCGKPGCKCAHGPGHGPSTTSRSVTMAGNRKWITSLRTITAKPASVSPTTIVSARFWTRSAPSITNCRGECYFTLALRYDFTSIRLSKGLSPSSCRKCPIRA